MLLELVDGDSSKFKFKNKSLIKFASGYPDAIFISLDNAYTICEDAAGVDVWYDRQRKSTQELSWMIALDD